MALCFVTPPEQHPVDAVERATEELDRLGLVR